MRERILRLLHDEGSSLGLTLDPYVLKLLGYVDILCYTLNVVDGVYNGGGNIRYHPEEG